MVRDLDMPVRVKACPTVREADGLAMSSRNANLSAEERRQALALVESLRLARRLVEGGTRSAADVLQAMRRHLAERAPSGEVDYVEIVDSDSLEGVDEISCPVVAAAALRFPSARLIDNMLLTPPEGPG
jgi:pantoate--beta-alanine ligase